MTRSRQTADWGSRAGLAKIVPSSVAVGSGTGSADAFGTVTFSGASSVSLNGVFSSAYDNYKIIYNLNAGTYSDVFLRLRNAGVDATGSNYYWSALYMTGTTLANNGGSTSATSSTFATVSTGGTSQGSWEINSPFLARITSGNRMNTNPSLGEFAFFGHTLANSYDGFTATGNLTGTLTVYGYTK